MAVLSLEDPFTALEEKAYPDWALSVYLPAAPDIAYDPRYQQKVFAELEREELSAAENGRPRNVLRREGSRVVEHLLHRTAPPGHALAVFAYEPYSLLRSWALPEDEHPRLRIGTRLDLEPLRRQLAKHPPALVVAVDKEGGRILRSLLGEVEAMLSYGGTEVARHHQGGWSELSYQRREDAVARHNLEVIARWLEHADLDFYSRVHLAGPPAARSALKRLLSARVTERLGRDLSVPMYVSPGAMAERLRRELGA